MPAAISADVVSYTALSVKDRRRLDSFVTKSVDSLNVRFKDDGLMGRMVSGDQIEFAMTRPRNALRIALLLKTGIKSFVPDDTGGDRGRLKYFEEHGVRIAVAIGDMESINPEKGILDGEAIHMAGRILKPHSTANKEKIIIKNTLFFQSGSDRLNKKYGMVFPLLDHLLSKCSAKRAEVLHLKLRGMSEIEVAEKLDRSQSTISRHSTVAGWNAVEAAVTYFEEEFP